MKSIIIPKNADWDLLRRFYVCSKNKSFVEAAKECNTSPDALRKQMFRLEDLFDEQIFVRYSKKVLTGLTPFGSALQRKVGIVIGFFSSDQPVEESYFSPEENERIKIYTTHGLLNTILLPCIIDFLKMDHKNVQFFFETTKSPKKIQLNQIHIRSDFAPQKNTITEKLFELEKGFYASEAYLEKIKDKDHLMGYEFIHSHGNLTLDGSGSSPFSKPPHIVSSDLLFSLKVCEEGIGVLRFPHGVKKPKNIIPVLSDQPEEKDAIFMSYLEQVSPHPILLKFVQHVKSYKNKFLASPS